MEDERHLWRIADGRPLAFTVADGTLLRTYGGGSGTLRPNIVGTPKRNHGSDWVDNYFAGNTALVHPAFLRPADFTLGDAPRTLGGVRSPHSFTTDLSVGKQFPIREEMNFEFRVAARNAFNHPVSAHRHCGGRWELRGRHQDVSWTARGTAGVQVQFLTERDCQCGFDDLTSAITMLEEVRRITMFCAPAHQPNFAESIRWREAELELGVIPA